MSDNRTAIRYVFLSDLHLGEAISILTPLNPDTGKVDTSKQPEVLKKLVSALREVLDNSCGQRKPVFVLAGDILGLAYATMTESLQLFSTLAELFLKPGAEICSDIIFVPGNHDHHIWEMAREHGYLQKLQQLNPDEDLPAVFHSSPMQQHMALSAPMLDALIQRVTGITDARIPVVYPNLILTGNDKDRVVIVHHGHFYEPHYHFISDGLNVLYPERAKPHTVEGIEALNFAWIDFIWSALGRSGKGTDDLESLFLLLRHPDDLKIKAKEFAANIAPVVDLPYLPFEWMERYLIRTVINRLGTTATGERAETSSICSETTYNGLKNYLFGPTFRQMTEELGYLPKDVSLVWGHTHKPFEKLLPGMNNGRDVSTINLGGWTVDYPVGSKHRGASIGFANENLDLAVLQLFTDAEDNGELLCTVVPPPGSASVTPFSSALESLITPDSQPTEQWQSLGEVIIRELALRHRLHRENSLA